MSGEKITNGTMQMKDGKTRIYLENEWHDFGPMFVAADMRKIAKAFKTRSSIYAIKMRSWASRLESDGMFGIKAIQDELKGLWGAREQWMAQDCRVWHEWLGKILMFKNVNVKKDKPVVAESNKNYRDNMDKIFQKVG